MKTREVFLSDEAIADIKSGRDFYDQSSEKVGDYFVAGILSDLESLSFYAGIHPLVHGFYRMLSRNFPFAVYYEIKDTQVWVVAVFDMRRKPEGIVDKLKSIVSGKKFKEPVAKYRSGKKNPPRKKTEIKLSHQAAQKSDFFDLINFDAPDHLG